ncbi:gtp-binding protein rho4 [Anaeramoeba ignava]|uniref:Gtp-binding protein rho4 n=1 Tax=Anaeramoeba ignava TaxID=1746090 RepID=A0A9Q0LEM8_ANAIG|nr:gtp-binding protein rho4 [Anaeramoeba ignava]
MTRFKLVCIGDGATGKTCMLITYAKNKCDDYDRLRPLSYPDSHVILIGYAIDNHVSFNNVKEKWQPEVLHFCPKTPIILVGLKIDLRGDPETLERLKKRNENIISSDQGKQLATEINAFSYIECSAKTRENLKDVFQESVRAAKSRKSSGGKCILL